ncbi:MAG: insulinase family protein [Candidatus Omnitrophica bacterium]|nr:insulinase family protein [Candidatus Omnitrophota bacterium]
MIGNTGILTLPNGIRVVAAPMKERKSVSIGLWVGVGGRDEDQRLGGVSHFLEHLVFKGTQTRTANQIKEAVEGIGGSLNAFTSEECTCFLAKIASRHFEKAFDVLVDMVLHASLKAEDIHKERTVIMEEIKMTQDQPSQFVDEILTELLWPGHALGRPIAGTLETVGAMTPDEIRAYRDRYYQPPLLTVVAAGDIDGKTLARAAESRFGHQSRPLSRRIDLFGKAPEGPRLLIYPKKTEQTHLALGLHAYPKEHPDEYALDLLSVALGGNMSSRLFNEVREERGLAYDVGSFVRRFHETGAFVVSAGVDNRHFEEALRVILSVLHGVAREDIGDAELERAREFYLGQLELGLENSMNHMLWIGDQLVTLGRCKTPSEVIEQVSRVRPQDLRRVARDLFTNRALHLGVVGPLEKSEEDRLRGLLQFPNA